MTQDGEYDCGFCNKSVKSTGAFRTVFTRPCSECILSEILDQIKKMIPESLK